jgi:hypothetical protein
VFEDLGFSPEEAALLRMKTQLHIEIRAIKSEGLRRGNWKKCSTCRSRA